ncbi:hypothetical protein AB6F89_15550 [Providencia hangzhouensis]|uniref:Uncharacterized protein n=1 Tax=Providencia rettgeri TaxID=587 RepID=A0AAW6UK26_PRORE|nr:hypothetical protein [Providencia rettgeri]MDI9092535.1 hypothetical protein [Providencia rettgeri]MDT2034790.1 hypothetical protein [Providencia rettgeri]
MEFKHSPAPWHLRDGVNEGYLLLDDNYNVIASLSTEIKREDENLIEAAPELLSELIRLRNIVASYKHDSGDNLDITDAVIAKALGQQ